MLTPDCNGNVLERILGPFQMVDTPEREALRAVAQESLSKRFYRHYAGFFQGSQREHDRRRTAKTSDAALTRSVDHAHRPKVARTARAAGVPRPSARSGRCHCARRSARRSP